MSPPRVETVLIVDDSLVQRLHMVGLLRQCGIHGILEAVDGIQALELLAGLDTLPHLIVVDLEMPGMDGVEFILQMMKRNVMAPLVISSNRDLSLICSVENMAQALGIPILAAWKKPLTKQHLAEILHHSPDRPPPSPSAPETHKEASSTGAHELALAISRHQLLPYYQPQIDLKSGTITGVEVLARWPHAEKGFIPPDHFIPLAEKHRLIHDLTLEIAGQAFARAAHWRRSGVHLTVAVNLSPRLLDLPDFVSEVDALLQQYQLPAEQVIWEVTESSLAADLGIALANLARLRLKGFGLSIDDYGTGFSSMQQLSRIPFTELKIDRSFVHRAHQREHLRVILQSALDMAHKMSLVTVAEGIETLEDWKLLREFGCNLAQGYFIAKPMPGETFTGWVKTQNTRRHGRRGS